MSHIQNRCGPSSSYAHALFGETAQTVVPSAKHSIFAHMAQSSDTLSARSDEAMGPLLAAAMVPHDDSATMSHPIWTTEALHRAHAVLKLFLMLHRSWPRIDRVTRVREQRLAIDLASKIAVVTGADSDKAETCAEALRDIACNLVALFGPCVGDVDIETDIGEVSLPRPRRRALVLLTHELIVNAILHAFAGHRRGRIIVTLRRISPCVAVLCVMDDGIGIRNDAIDAGGIAAGLATVLASDLYYGRTLAGLTKIEAIFELEQIETAP
jgi:hypothetical protein